MERAAGELERVARTAPDDTGKAAPVTVASALRGLAFAVEADRLLRRGAAAPTGAQLAQADEAKRARQTELDAAIGRMAARTAPPK